MRIQAIPTFNTVYADAEHVMYVYNALIPRRATAPGIDWSGVVPGDRKELVWDEYLGFDELPPNPSIHTGPPTAPPLLIMPTRPDPSRPSV